jgi:hypothetical protein
MAHTICCANANINEVATLFLLYILNTCGRMLGVRTVSEF